MVINGFHDDVSREVSCTCSFRRTILVCSDSLVTIQLESGKYTKTKINVMLLLEAITLIPSFLQEYDGRKLPGMQD